jgi:hypothetical protein
MKTVFTPAVLVVMYVKYAGLVYVPGSAVTLICVGIVDPSITLPLASTANDFATVPLGTELIFNVFVVVSPVAVTLSPCTSPDAVSDVAERVFTPVSDLLFRSVLLIALAYGINRVFSVSPLMVMLVTLRLSSPFRVFGNTLLLI